MAIMHIVATNLVGVLYSYCLFVQMTIFMTFIVATTVVTTRQCSVSGTFSWV
jgi:hypothetical protein